MLVPAVEARTGAAAQAVETRARVRQGVAVTQCTGTAVMDGGGGWLVQAVAVATATGGYGRRRGRSSEKPGLGCGSRATERALRMLKRGIDEVNENFWPSPGLNKV